jgi:AAA domain
LNGATDRSLIPGTPEYEAEFEAAYQRLEAEKRARQRDGAGDVAARLRATKAGGDAAAAISGREPSVVFPVRTARELCSLADPPAADLLVGPFVVRGQRTIIVGDSGHGKTTLCLQLLAAVVTGGEVFNCKGARSGPVLVIDLEQGVRSIKRALREAKLADRDDVLYITIPDGLALDADPAHRAELERIVGERQPVVAMLDPYYKAHRGDANDERAVVDLMRYLDRLRATHGFALVLPAHPRKTQNSNGARKLTLDDLAGSGAASRGAELVLGLERLSHGYARLRILKDREGDLPVGEAWPLVFERGEGFKLDPRDQKAAEEIEARILTASGEWRTIKEWAALLHVRETIAKQHLDALEATGAVEFATGPAGRSPTARCYRSAPDPEAQSGEVAQ